MGLSSLWIIFFSLFGLSIFGLVLFAKVFSKPVDEQKVRLSRIFPYEVGSSTKQFRTFLYLFSFACFTPIFILKEKKGLFVELDSIGITISSLLGLAAVAFIFLSIFEAKHIKAHISLFVIFISLILLGSALSLVRAIDISKATIATDSEKTISYISIALSSISALLILLIIVNPKLKNWAKLEKVEGTDDEYVRPKYFPLAYSEWIGLLSLIISTLSTFLQFTIH